MSIKTAELHSFMVYERQVHHEIGRVGDTEFHRFTVDPFTYREYRTQWSRDENGAFNSVLKRLGKTYLALIVNKETL